MTRTRSAPRRERKSSAPAETASSETNDSSTPADTPSNANAPRAQASSVDSPALRVLSSRNAALLAIAAGCLYFLGFAGFDYWPLSMVSMVPLLFALRGRQGRASFLLGWLMGTVAMSGGFYWIVSMLRTFSGFPTFVCIAFATLLWAAQGLQFGLIALIVTRADRARISRLVSLPAALGAMELVYPLLFPWYTSNSLHTATVLIQTADLGGPILISMAMCALHAGIELALAGPVHRAPDAPPIDTKTRLRPLLVPVAFWLLSVPYGMWRIAQVDQENKTAPAMKVAVVQENLGLKQKRNDPRTSLQMHVHDTLELQEKGVDLVVWSESALSLLFDDSVTNVKEVLSAWEKIRVPVLFGGLSERGDKIYNTAFMAAADGTVLGTYDKTFLLAFGEYLPGGETFPDFYKWSPNSGHFTAGTRQVALPLPRVGDGASYTVMPLICYEDILPRFVSSFQRQTNTSLFAVILNDAWFGPSTEPWIHFALSKFRSIEHRRDFVRASNSGVSGFVDAAGRVIANGGTFNHEAIVATVHLRTRSTPYGLLGDWAGVLAVLASGYAIWKGRAPKRSATPATA